MPRGIKLTEKIKSKTKSMSKQGYKPQEIADYLGISPVSVKRILSAENRGQETRVKVNLSEEAVQAIEMSRQKGERRNRTIERLILEGATQPLDYVVTEAPEKKSWFARLFGY